MKVQGQKEVQKSLMHVQSCCFANLNTLLFSPLSLSLPSPYTSNISLYRLSAGSKLYQEKWKLTQPVILVLVSQSVFHFYCIMVKCNSI